MEATTKEADLLIHYSAARESASYHADVKNPTNLCYHNGNYTLCYITMGKDIKTDCYWHFIPQDGRYLIRNAQNDEYLAYESDASNTDKKKLVLKTDITPRCLWNVEVYKGTPRISFTDGAR